jgi:hypothetical protein
LARFGSQPDANAAASQHYDTANLEALRLELKRINEDALCTGLLHPPRSAPPEPAPSTRKARRGSSEKGKAGAARMLALLGRISGDESPPVPGTDFTESGVVRLLAHLSKPHDRPRVGYAFLQRLRRFLTRPLQMGIHTSAGVSVERLCLVGRYLKMIETHGYEHFQAYRAARRGRLVQTARAAAARNKPRRRKLPAPERS